MRESVQPVDIVPDWAGLYDLARCLCGDDHHARELIVRVLQPQDRDAGRQGTGAGAGDHRVLLVRAYLKTNRLPSARLARLMSSFSRRARQTTTSPSKVRMALDILGPRERVCLILRERYGYGVREIAGMTGLGYERTRLALSAARQHMRAVIFDGVIWKSESKV